MFNIVIWKVSVILVVMSVFNIESAMALRNIYVHVELEGQTMLEGSTSDDGSPDADEVWETFLRDTENHERWAAFRETKYFDNSLLNPVKSSDSKFVLRAKEGMRFRVSINFGGDFFVRELTLHKVKTEDPKKVWVLDPEQLDAQTEFRYITRYEASRLKNPMGVKEK